VSNAPTFFCHWTEAEVANATLAVLVNDLSDRWSAEGVKHVRLTVVSDEFPNPFYPHGVYVEGWTEAPNPEPPFAFPMTAAV